jgi:hypothetical protein
VVAVAFLVVALAVLSVIPSGNLLLLLPFFLLPLLFFLSFPLGESASNAAKSPVEHKLFYVEHFVFHDFPALMSSEFVVSSILTSS